MKRIIFTMAAAAICLTACVDDNTPAPSAKKITIAPDISLTRATEVSFEKGDRIGVTVIKADGLFHTKNAMFTHDGSLFSGDIDWYTEVGETSHLVAYHPYDDNGAPGSFTVALDQRDGGYGASDLMGAGKPGVTPSASAVGMTFYHLLTKLSVGVTNESGADVVSIVFQGAIPTADVDLKGLSVAVDETVASAEITAQQITKNALYRAIVVPQQVALTVIVTTSDGKALSKPLAMATLRQGGQYSVDIAISAAMKLEATISGSIEGWTDEGSIPGEIADDPATPPVAAGGFFVVNEDWFGHDNGTVNYFKKEGKKTYTPIYRAYRAVNPAEADRFGVATQFATIWGKYAFFSSKQGNRLVVADAETLARVAIFPELGPERNSDGRAFVGVTDTKGYMGHGNGIVVFDIENMRLGDQIAGVSGQIGAMCEAAGRVFAVSQDNGLHVIDSDTDTVEQTIAGTYNTLTRSRDGNVWVAAKEGFVKINPETLETETLAYPAGASIGGSWGAWNAGSLCASTRTNTLYWTSGGGMFGGGKSVVKYDIATGTATTIHTLLMSPYGAQLVFYGAGMRVDPLTDELVLTVKHDGYGVSGAYNWIYILDADGREKTNFEYFGDNGRGAGWATGKGLEEWDDNYFWFPAMPMFEDANKPQILLNQIVVGAGETVTVDLSEKIVDYDNTAASIQKGFVAPEDGMATIALSGDKLTVKAGEKRGSTGFVLSAVSNGVRVEKRVRIDIIR